MFRFEAALDGLRGALGGARRVADLRAHEHADAAAELETNAATLVPADASARELRPGRQHVHADVVADVRADEGPDLSANLRPDARVDHSQLPAHGGTARINEWRRCAVDAHGTGGA